MFDDRCWTMRLWLRLFVIGLVSTRVSPMSVSEVNADGMVAFPSHELGLSQQMHRFVTAARSTNRRLSTLTAGSSLQPICDAMELNFPALKVDCVCMGSSPATLSMACEYLDPICGPSGVCGRPFLALAMVDYRVFSSTVCLYNYTRHGVALEDTCIGVELGAASQGDVTGLQFTGCTAKYGSNTCQECSVCAGGRGLHMDCSNANAEIVTDECETIDTDLDLSGATSTITGFLPNLNGLCSHLESSVDNAIECDCRDSGGGNFTVACATPAPQCRGGVCALTESKVKYVHGDLAAVQSCTDYEAPIDARPTCVALTVGDQGGWQDCFATYNGTACRSCEICQDGGGLTLDCTNVAEWASVSSCQALTLEQALGLVPNFTALPKTVTTSAAAPGSSGLALIVALLVGMAWYSR